MRGQYIVERVSLHRTRKSCRRSTRLIGDTCQQTIHGGLSNHRNDVIQQFSNLEKIHSNRCRQLGEPICKQSSFGWPRCKNDHACMQNFLIRWSIAPNLTCWEVWTFFSHGAAASHSVTVVEYMAPVAPPRRRKANSFASQDQSQVN